MTSRKVLTYAGVLPYLIGIAICLTPYKFTIWPFLAVLISSYSALIISFIAGSLWGLVLNSEGVKIRLISNVITLVAWFGLLFPSWIIGWSILILCFLSLLFVEYRLYHHHIMDKCYFKMRVQVTIIVIMSFVIMTWLGLKFI